jgi:hypothetical protein
MSLLDQARKLEQQVVNRLKELEPLTREYDQLRKLAERLGVKYSPESGKSGAGATSATTARRSGTRAAAAKRATRTPAKAKAGQPRTSAQAKAAAKPRGTRSTGAARTTASTQPTGASGKTAAARPRKRAATSRQQSRGRRAAARPGQRHDDLLRLVRENPGITVREVGERLGVDATGLYRVVRRLSDEGRVRKDGRRLQPVDSSAVSEPKPDTTGDTATQTPAPSGADVPESTPTSGSEPSPPVAASTRSGDG